MKVLYTFFDILCLEGLSLMDLAKIIPPLEFLAIYSVVIVVLLLVYRDLWGEAAAVVSMVYGLFFAVAIYFGYKSGRKAAEKDAAREGYL